MQTECQCYRVPALCLCGKRETETPAQSGEAGASIYRKLGLLLKILTLLDSQLAVTWLSLNFVDAH